MWIALLAAALVGGFVVANVPAQDPQEQNPEKVKPLMVIRPKVPAPQLDGDWWRITRQPDLGALSDARQQPVDFAVWQARDGSWQLWSCIRLTRHPGHSRLFFRWEGRRINDRDWRPRGIAMRSDPALGERARVPDPAPAAAARAACCPSSRTRPSPPRSSSTSDSLPNHQPSPPRVRRPSARCTSSDPDRQRLRRTNDNGGAGRFGKRLHKAVCPAWQVLLPGAQAAVRAGAARLNP